MARKITEAAVKRKLIAALNKLSKQTTLWHSAWSDRYTSGLPDRVVITRDKYYLGRVWFIECKRPREPLRKLQLKVIEAMRYAGGHVRVYRGEPIESVEDIYKLPMS